MTCGVIEPKEEWQGMAYQDTVPIAFDEVDEYSLALSKEYHTPITYFLDDVCYTDLGVMYAKLANAKAFESYDQYIGLDEKAKAKHVMDYGEPKPYSYQVITKELHEEVAQQEKTKLQEMYKRGK